MESKIINLGVFNQKMSKEQIDNFKELYKIFYDIAEKIAKDFAEFFKIYYDFTQIKLRENYITIIYCQYNDSYYSGSDEIYCISVKYEDLLSDYNKIIKDLIDERQKDIDFENKQEKEKEEQERQKEIQKELELYKKLKEKFKSKYDD